MSYGAIGLDEKLKFNPCAYDYRTMPPGVEKAIVACFKLGCEYRGSLSCLRNQCQDTECSVRAYIAKDKPHIAQE